MAAAVTVSIPVRHAFSDYLAIPGVTVALSRLELDRLMARHTPAQSAGIHRLEYIGSGQWVVQEATHDGHFYTDWSISGLTADHLYLLSPHGDMRAFSVVSTVSTTTAPADGNVNTSIVLTDSAATFTTEAVVVGDVVVLASGAHAYVTAVTSQTVLQTDPLPYGALYTAGQTFYVVRSPGSDTTATYSPTARVVEGKRAAIEQINRWLTARSFEKAVSVGGVSDTPSVEPVRQRLSELVGVGYSSA